MIFPRSWFGFHNKRRASQPSDRCQGKRKFRPRLEELESRLAPAGITLLLDPGSDTGASNSDGVTRVTVPVFDVILDQGGLIDMDFDGNGTYDATRSVSAAGTYSFTSSTLSDGVYTVKAHFDPTTGAPGDATVSVTIDTKAPTLLPATPAAFGDNLIVNGDAEAGVGSNNGNVVPVPGWTTTSGTFTAVKYNSPPSFPTTSDPGPLHRGENFFAGGPATSNSSAEQIIDLSSEAGLIDTGDVIYELSGFLGGWTIQGDAAILQATFKGASGASLGSAGIGPVTPVNRSSTTGLLYRITSGTIPIGTRSILVHLQMTWASGNYNDGYADNLSLILLVGSTEAAPLSRRTVRFSEPIDPATLHERLHTARTGNYGQPGEHLHQRQHRQRYDLDRRLRPCYHNYRHVHALRRSADRRHRREPVRRQR